MSMKKQNIMGMFELAQRNEALSQELNDFALKRWLPECNHQLEKQSLHKAHQHEYRRKEIDP